MVGEKYIEAVAARRERAAGARTRSRVRDRSAVACWMPATDCCSPGSASNVEPHHYGGPASEPGTLHDPNRDATTLPLIPRAIAAGLPVLAICRGFQEMNVAYGGTLHQRLHEVPGYLDHRDDESAAARRAIRTRARSPAGAWRSTCEKSPDGIACKVNSLHWQGVETLGADLAVEARAPDGVIEAFRVADAPSFRAWRCNGIRNGSSRRIHFLARCLPPLARPAGSAQQAAR